MWRCEGQFFRLRNGFCHRVSITTVWLRQSEVLDEFQVRTVKSIEVCKEASS
jgi:hypothetical protein